MANPPVSDEPDFPESQSSPGSQDDVPEPLDALAAIDPVTGPLIEGSFFATFPQRFFNAQ